MARVLELLFLNTEGKTVKVNVDEPKQDITEADINAAMDQLLAASVFTSNGGEYISKKGARIIERNVNELSL
ncbi:DUF2922 family protein [Bacillus lacus]|uniref:DUF2922 family protein n=1 Tax=Metabacillus lacus TaxID=1983721 RepID=A0A7X2LZS2_9BACI|nr:DUF2922 domain-containing protein [Metabacillus lacus]MRX72262.1 DUF2922 family protein [Metabacillus lacus]